MDEDDEREIAKIFEGGVDLVVATQNGGLKRAMDAINKPFLGRGITMIDRLNMPRQDKP